MKTKNNPFRPSILVNSLRHQGRLAITLSCGFAALHSSQSAIAAGANVEVKTQFVTITAVPEPRAALLLASGVHNLFRRCGTASPSPSNIMPQDSELKTLASQFDDAFPAEAVTFLRINKKLS